jgi:hypothetical protein
VAEIVLDQAQVVPLVGEREVASRGWLELGVA